MVPENSLSNVIALSLEPKPSIMWITLYVVSVFAVQ